jgi:CheY-like chemotaxis protein
LVAEDDEVSYFLLANTLSKEKCRLIRAKDGKEALEIFNNTPDIQLVLMDMKMPIMDGITATKEIRKINKDLPIIAQTAYALEGDKEKALEAGCNDYISKPIDKNHLLELINKYTENYAGKAIQYFAQ